MNKYNLRNILCIALVVLYVAGLLCMFLNQLGAGIALWAVSTVGGMAALYHIRNAEEKEAAKKEKDGDDDHANEA